MKTPGNPPEDQGPLDNQNPLEDPLLDALEQSIENPPGFVDPLVENDSQFMDGLAKQLDQVEASIENTPPLPPKSEMPKDENELNAQDDELTALEATSLSEEHESLEAMNDSDETLQSSQSASQDSSEDRTNPNRKLPRLRRQQQLGRSRKRVALIFKRPVSGRTGRVIPVKGRDTRICPESREFIYEKECKSCKKYRHWPEGTNEEPRKCWYDWQREETNDEADDSDE